MEQVKITDDYRNIIKKSPRIMAVRFVGGQPVEVISEDPRYQNEQQVLLTRAEILGEDDK